MDDKYEETPDNFTKFAFLVISDKIMLKKLVLDNQLKKKRAKNEGML